MTSQQTAGRPGLHYLPDFLTDGEQASLIREIDQGSWNSSLSRRVQQYGYRYNYKRREVTAQDYIGPLPEFLAPVAERLHQATEDFAECPVQCIVNEYISDQGIAYHYDAVSFGPAIATISLLETWNMEFHRKPSANTIHGERNSLLETGSALIMTGESRYNWKHSIPRRKEEPDGTRRGRRISLTFRTIQRR